MGERAGPAIRPVRCPPNRTAAPNAGPGQAPVTTSC